MKDQAVKEALDLLPSHPIESCNAELRDLNGQVLSKGVAQWTPAHNSIWFFPDLALDDIRFPECEACLSLSTGSDIKVYRLRICLLGEKPHIHMEREI